MTDDKMENVLKKLGLFDHRARFLEEKISTDIVSYWYLQKIFLNLDQRIVMLSCSLELSVQPLVYALRKG